MTEKVPARPAPRQPRQERSRYKVQLILEATTRLLEQGGIEALSTNAIATMAGVSIGTLYQFFPDKAAILDTLAEREVARMSAQVLAALEEPGITSVEARIAAVVEAVAASYGHCENAHRAVMVWSLGRSGGGGTAALLRAATAHLSQADGGVGPALDPASAFVISHAFAGVLRAMTLADDKPPQHAIVQALMRMVMPFVA
jgi:AcrR family transcriptional regulator